MVFARLSLLPIALMLLHGSIEAQVKPPVRTVVLRDPPCTNCLRIQAVARFGDDAGEGVLRGLPRMVVRDQFGRVFIADQNGGAPQVFDSTGKFLRMLGRVGSGPGEFRQPSGLIPFPDGRLAVFDIRLARLNVFDKSLSLLTSRPTKLRTIDAVKWRGDTLLVPSVLNTPASSGYPYHFTTLEVEGPLFSFAVEPLKTVPRGEAERGKAAVVGEHYCVSRERRLAVFCSNSITGRPVEFKYSPSWFKDDASLLVEDGQAPTATFKSMIPLSATQLLITVLVPDPKYKQGIQHIIGVDGPTWEIVDMNSYYDTVLLVLDIAQQRLTAISRSPEALLYPAGPNHLVSVNEGEGYVTLWRVLTSN